MKNGILKTFWSKIVAVASVFVTLVTVLSCEIGLGEAVDVSAPTLTITYPPSGAIIRDSFVLAGECKDDVMITNVNVRVVNTTSGKEVYNGTAEVSGTAWKIDLNDYDETAYAATNGWQYADGTYEITAWANDNSGKTSGVSSRSVDVDNTAPVFIIQSPGVTKKKISEGSTATAYGTVFTVSGTIVDIHEIGKLSMKFYDEDGTEISDAAYVESSVPTAGGTEVTIATYVNDENYSTSQYNKLYKGIADENSETKKFYCTIELEDAAKEYKGLEDNRDLTGSPDAGGNRTSDVYLYDDVFTDFLSTKTATVVQGGLSAANFMNVLNGTYSSANAAAIKEEILKRRKDTTVTENNLAFSLNPNADPKYIVNGFELTKVGDAYGTSTEEGSSTKISQAGNNNTLNISISAGLDGTAIAPWSVHVWMYDFGNVASNFKTATVQDVVRKFRTASKDAHKDKAAGGFVTKSGSKYIIAESDNADYKNYIVEQVPGIEYVGDNIKSGASSSKQTTVSTNLPRTIATGHYYVILVSGYDVERTEFAQSETFGFVGMATGERPKIAVTSPADLSYAKMSDDVVFKGTATKGDAVVKEVKATITVTDEADGTIVGDTENNPLTYSKEWDAATDTQDVRNWTINLRDVQGYSKIKADEASGKSYLYSVKFEAIDTAENSADITRSIHVDAVKPEVAITSITPVVAGEDYDGSSNNYVNGNITVKANISETNLAEVNLKVLVDGADVTSTVFPGEAEPGKLGKTFQVNKKINTTLVADNKPIEIIITAIDTVGNTTEYSSKEFNGNVDYIVNQDSDKPVFKFMNFADHNVYATEAQAEAGKFYNTVEKAQAGSANANDMTACPDGQIAVKGKIVAGKYNNGYQIYEYLMIIENSNLFSESNKNMMFSVTDDDMIKNVAVKIYREDGTTVAKSDTKDGSGTTYQGNIEVPSADGVYYFEISATDEETGKTSVTRTSDKIKFAVSSHKPVINFNGSGSTYFKADHDVNVAGTVASWDGHVVLSRVTGTTTPVSFGSGNIGAFTDNPTAIAPSDGSTINTVEYEAVNTFGQKTSATFSYNIDDTLPEISISSITPVVTSRQADDTYKYFVNGIISVTGKSTDNSDIDYVEYKVFKGATVPADQNVSPVANGIFYKTTETGKVNSGFENSSTVNSWEFTVDTTNISGADNSTKDSMCIQITAYDLAGNRKSVTSNEFLKVQSGSATDVSYFVDQDTDKPELVPSNFSIGKTSGKIGLTDDGLMDNLFGKTNNNKITATVTDDDGIDTIKVEYRKNGTNGTYTTLKEETVSKTLDGKKTGATSYSLNLVVPETMEEGIYDFKVTMKDVVGSSAGYNANEISTVIGVTFGAPYIDITQPPSGKYVKTNDTINVSGIVSSNKKTSADTIVSVVRAGTSTNLIGGDVTNGKEFSESIVSENGASGTTVELKYIVTDIFNQTSEKSISYILDNTAPEFKYSVTKTDGTVQFMIAGEAFDSSKWYAGTDLSIEGYFMDNHSGINTVHYELTPSGYTTGEKPHGDIAVSQFKDKDNNQCFKFKGTISGYAKGDGNSLKLWTVDEAGNGSGNITITIKMDDAVPDFEAKYLSVDNGATSSEAGGTVTVNGMQKVIIYGTLSDKDSGIDLNSFAFKINNADFADGKKPSIAYTTTADLSDWDKIKAAQYYTIPADTSKITGWKAEFKASSIVDGPLSVAVADGTKKNTYRNSSVLTFEKDAKAPTFKISSAQANVNGTRDITGTASEERTITSMRLYYSLKNEGAYGSGKDYKGGSTTVITDSPETFGWIPVAVDEDAETKKYELTDASDIYSWSFKNFDFNTKSGAKDATDGKATIYILPVIKDAAGNCSAYSISLDESTNVTTYTWNLKETAKAFSVDMNADRPVVQITNLSKNGNSYTLMYGTNATVTGSISDDDSTSTTAVETFIAAEKEITKVEKVTGTNTYKVTFKDNATRTYLYSADDTVRSWTSSKATDADENEFSKGTTLKVNDWSYTPEDVADGNKDVYFYVKDNAGTEFFTKKESKLYQPYVQYKSDPKSDSSEGLTFKSDCTSPAVRSCEIVSSEKKEAAGVGALVGGPNEPKVQFVITGFDDNGVNGVTIEIQDAEKVEDSSKGKTVKYYKWINDAKTISGFDKGGTFTIDGSDTKKSTWTTPEIDISGWATGTANVTVTVYDGSGLMGNGSYNFTVDNSEPTITLQGPRATDEVTGEVKVYGISADIGAAGVKSIEYCIPKTTDTEATYDWKNTWSADSSVMSWAFIFSKNTGANYCPSLEEFDNATYCGSNISNGIYTIPIKIRAEDEQGNVVILDSTIKHNPDGDKPKVEFSYPSSGDYDKDASGVSKGYKTLGGVIPASGSAKIPSGTTTVRAVYMQIGNEDGSVYDKSYAEGKGYTVVTAYDVINEYLGADTYAQGSTLADDVCKKYGFNSAQEVKDWWGIKTNGTAAWNYVLNKNGKLNPPNNDTTTNITLRACGVNAECKFGAWTTDENVIKLHIDNNAPTISSSVRQYGDGSSAIAGVPADAADAVQKYDADMFLKGHWTLVLDILDIDDVASITVQKKGVEITSGTDYFMKPAEEGTGDSKKTGYTVFIPIDKSDDSVEYTVVALDPSSHPANEKFSFKIDETAPTLEKDDDASYDIEAENPAPIANTNYKFTLGGKSTDVGSGVERIVFYFMRDVNGDGKTTYAEDDTAKKNPLSAVVFDPMIKKESGSKIAMSDLVKKEITQGAVKYPIYGRNIKGKSTTEKFTLSSGTVDSHVRVGGLVEIDGIFRKITSVSSDKKSVEFTPSLPAEKTSEFDAFFLIAQVIDNLGVFEETKNNTDNPFTFKKGDDGDGMPESINKSGSVWTWDASVHSDNMDDGPASIVILAFDKAGNVSSKTIETTISNNAPRVAKVWFGTDISGDGKYVNDDVLEELVEYDIFKAEGSAQAEYELDFTAKDEKDRLKYSNGIFVIKNGLAIVPELTGGNGDIGMVLDTAATKAEKKTGTVAGGTLYTSVGSSTTDTTTDPDTGAVTSVNVKLTGDVAGDLKGTDPTYKMKAYVVPKEKLGSDAASKGMSFTFWDSTEETTMGTNSQYSVLYVKNFKVEQTDNTAPKVVVNPFWWNAAGDNSLYGNSTANGHIELEKDLSEALKNAFKVAGTDPDGTDPKVSGKIVVTGTAYDNTRLKNIQFTFGSANAVNVATFEDNKWNYGTKSGDTWTPYTIAENGYEIEIMDKTVDERKNVNYYGNWGDDVFFGQKGHKIYWKLSLDTEKLIANAVKKDVTLTVKAIDAANKVTSVATADVTAASPYDGTTKDRVEVTVGTTNIPNYRMDVVPYVLKVETGLSKQKKSNWSVYNRSALGHYPVQSVVQKASTTASGTKQRRTTSEDVILHGFNLNGTVAAKDKDNGDLVMTSVAPAGTAMSQIKFNVAKLASGKLSPTVNGISIINNMNDNNAKGNATSDGTANANKYNMQGNGDTNNILTDDLVFDVWEFNDRAAVPINGMATGVQMQVNQVGNLLNFAFANGGLYYSMGNKEYSSRYWAGDWDTFAGPCVGLGVDSLGYTYGVDSGGDTNNSGHVDKYAMFTSRWGRGTRGTGGTYGGGNALRLEEIAIKTGDGTYAYSLMKYRYLSSEFASSVSDKKTNLYLVNYDALTDEIRFRAGTFSGTSKQSVGGFNDTYQSNTPSYYATDNCQVIANNSNDGGSFPKDNNGGTIDVAAISGRGAGQYVDIAVAKDGQTDVACVVWFDAYDNCLKYTYYVNPIGNWNNLKGNRTAAGWSQPTTIFEEGGEYCQIAVDANNHLHIAAYAGNGDVKYAYLDSYNSSYSESANSCTVDASGAVGEHLTLDVALDGNGNSIPYIGYFTAAIKAPKYAYLVDTTHANKVPAGVDDDERFTGAWEVTVVPTPSRPTTNREDKINVGVFKTDAGVLNWSTTDGNTPGTDNIGTNYCSSSTGDYDKCTEESKAYGNGSKNAVFAYQIAGGTGSCIETAQMR